MAEGPEPESPSAAVGSQPIEFDQPLKAWRSSEMRVRRSSVVHRLAELAVRRIAAPVGCRFVDWVECTVVDSIARMALALLAELEYC